MLEATLILLFVALIFLPDPINPVTLWCEWHERRERRRNAPLERKYDGRIRDRKDTA